MQQERLAEVAKYFEEYLHGNPLAAETNLAGLLFRKMAKEEYDLQTETFRSQMTFEQFRANELIPAIHQFLDRRQAKFPTPTPEKKRPS